MKKLPKELFEHLVYCKKYENDIIIGKIPLVELKSEDWVAVILQMFEEGFIPYRQKEIKHLYYSKIQEITTGCMQGRLMTGEFVKYTFASKEITDIEGQYLGLGEHISVLSKGGKQYKGNIVDSGKILT